jgi:hypothetical protein
VFGREPRQHFTFNAVQNNVGYQSVVRDRPELLAEIDRQRRGLWDLVFTLQYNSYYEIPRPELLVQDLHPHAEA